MIAAGGLGALAERDYRKGFLNPLDRALCGTKRLVQLRPGISKPSSRKEAAKAAL